jgi:hypothetical protein
MWPQCGAGAGPHTFRPPGKPLIGWSFFFSRAEGWGGRVAAAAEGHARAFFGRWLVDSRQG